MLELITMLGMVGASLLLAYVVVRLLLDFMKSKNKMFLLSAVLTVVVIMLALSVII